MPTNRAEWMYWVPTNRYSWRKTTNDSSMMTMGAVESPAPRMAPDSTWLKQHST